MHFFRLSVNAMTEQRREWASWSFNRFNRTLVQHQPRSALKVWFVRNSVLLSGWGYRTTAPGLPTALLRCRCPPDLRPPRCLPCHPHPAPLWRLWDSLPSPSSAFPLKTSGHWDPGFREGKMHFIKKTRTFNTVYSWDDVRSEPSPECYTVLIHGFLVIVDSHQEISQHPVQDTVALIGQGATEERDPFFIFLFPTFMRNRPALAYVRPWKRVARI